MNLRLIKHIVILGVSRGPVHFNVWVFIFFKYP